MSVPVVQPFSLSKRRVIVLISTLLLTGTYWILALWYNHKTASSKDLVVFHYLLNSVCSGSKWMDLYQYFYQFALTVLLYLTVPCLIIKYYLKEDFKILGWNTAFNRGALLLCALVYPLVIISIYYTSNSPVLVAEYPLSKLIGTSWLLFFTYEAAYFFYFLSYETLYRGFLQFGLKSPNASAAEIGIILLIQTLITTLFHIGKPGTEILSAAVFGPVLGYVAIRFNSIWYGMLIHFLMNISMDFFILHRLHLLPGQIPYISS